MNYFCRNKKALSAHLLLSQRLKVSRILGISLSTRRTQLVLVRSNAVPAEPANLVATRARIEAQIVDLERFHAQWAFR